jgi:hypothetical protein
MGMFVYYPLLTQSQAQYTYDGIRKWFEDHPERDDCKTESFVAHRNSLKEDILKNSEKDVVLQETPKHSDFSKSLQSEKPKKKATKKAAATKTAKATKKVVKK